MANSRQGAYPLISGYGFKLKNKSSHTMYLRRSTLAKAQDFDPWKDWWLGSGGKKLKIYDGTSWVTLSSW